MSNQDELLWITFNSFCDKLLKKLANTFPLNDSATLAKFKYLKCNSDRIRFLRNQNILDKISQYLEELLFNSKGYDKDEEKARKYRINGNDAFKEGRYQDAHDLYSDAIRFAPNNGTELALSFGNRSAVNRKLNLLNFAIQDIDYAIKYGYPQENIEKLNKRKSQCIDMLEVSKKLEEEDAQNSIENVERIMQTCSLGECNLPSLESFNPLLKNSSKKIKIGFDERKGRSIIANDNISFGELLIVDKAFASILFPECLTYYCVNCLKYLKGCGLPCPTCNMVFFCGEECIALDIHSKECGFILNLYNHLGIALLVLRIINAAKINNCFQIWNQLYPFNKFLNEQEYKSDYETVLKLMNHEENFDSYKCLLYTLSSFFLRMIIQVAYPGNWSEENQIIMEEIILLHIQQISVNTLMINERESVIDSNIFKAKPTKAIGLGIFPILSLLNHSCKPNAFLQYFDCFIVVRALNDISCGEEVCFCYGPNLYSDTYKDRQKKLMKSHNFECVCEACEQKLNSKKNAFLCPNCRGQLIINEDKTNHCSICNNENISIDERYLAFEENLERMKKGEEHLNKKDYDEAIKEISSAYNVMINILHPHNMYLIKCRTLFYESLAEFGHFDKAYKFCLVNSKVFTEIYGSQSVEYGECMIKAYSLFIGHINQLMEDGVEAYNLVNDLNRNIENTKNLFKRLAEIGKKQCKISNAFSEELKILERQSKFCKHITGIKKITDTVE